MRIISSRVLLTTLEFTAGVGPGNISELGSNPVTLGSRGYFFLIDTDGWRRSRVNEEKNNLWSQEYATSFPCEKSVQNLNWVSDWILPCQVVRCSQSGPLLYC